MVGASSLVDIELGDLALPQKKRNGLQVALEHDQGGRAGHAAMEESCCAVEGTSLLQKYSLSDGKVSAEANKSSFTNVSMLMLSRKKKPTRN